MHVSVRLCLISFYKLDVHKGETRAIIFSVGCSFYVRFLEVRSISPFMSY
jgi:hypothetical protein